METSPPLAMVGGIDVAKDMLATWRRGLAPTVIVGDRR
jgi:hypothetical protein